MLQPAAAPEVDEQGLAPSPCRRQSRRMSRLSLFALPLALAACGAAETPIQSAPATPQLFRGGQGEVRLRCGSETLRARLRQGQLAVQVGTGESTVLVPVEEPRARSGPAYGAGKLTLYKLPEAERWMLARSGGEAPAECRAGG